MKYVRNFALWILKRNSRSANLENEDLSTDLSIEEIYQKSRHLARKLFNAGALSTAIKINELMFAFIIQDFLTSWIGSMASSTLAFAVLFFLLMLPSSKIENAWKKKAKMYSRVMQKRVDELGIGSVSSLLAILHKMVNAPQTQIDEVVVSNLTLLLPQMGSEDYENLTEQNKSLLYSLVDPKSAFCSSLKFNEKNRLRLFATLLLSTSIAALGTMGGYDAVEVLQSRLVETSNPLLRKALVASLNECNPLLTPAECHPSIIAESEAMGQQVADKSKMTVLNRLKRSKLQIVGYATLLTVIMFGYVFFYCLSLKHNHWYSGLLALLPFFIASMFATLIERKSMIDHAEIPLQIFDHSPLRSAEILALSLNELFSIENHTMYGQLVGETLLYEDLENIPALSKNEVDRLNSIINNFILSCYVHENDGSSEDLLSFNPYFNRFRYRKSDRRIIKIILRAVGILGNGDTLTSLHRFIRMSNDQELNAIAEKSIEELNVKLRVTDTLLRSSDLPDSSLLKPSQSDEGTGHLLKLPASGLVLRSTEERRIEENQITQKQ